MKTLLIFLLLLNFSCNKSSTQSVESGSKTDSTSPPVVEDPKSSWTDEYMELVNNHGRSLGLRSLIHDEDVAGVVRLHSQNMASGAVAFGHTGFSARCSQTKTILGGGNWCGENVAAGQATPKAAFNSWMNSAGHRANLEQTRATHTGFGYAKSPTGKYYWTQIFLEL